MSLGVLFFVRRIEYQLFGEPRDQYFLMTESIAVPETQATQSTYVIMVIVGYLVLWFLFFVSGSDLIEKKKWGRDVAGAQPAQPVHTLGNNQRCDKILSLNVKKYSRKMKTLSRGRAIFIPQ